ncbi:beta-ketoacyl synthase N-terminal-like domain-containing protein, partial [Streptomyces sp.]|uniref:beta-ketoacyl synthase N-terminal-like domain-containing protein n=1 Tax=Streptomyces sp. TaxID=1931 RepID=UPI002F3EA76F
MTAVPPDAIAVVGMAVRTPGAAGVGAFWANTLAGTVSVTRHTDADGALLRARGELPATADFDPGFFGMSPRDALLLDPQHRLLLECSWEALADAGESGDRARTAVFAGVNYSGYRELLGQSTTRVSAVEFDSGVDKDFAATTTAYRLGLQGPCLTVQTACSSSLVAVHLAVQSLLEFDADQALAGGVSVVLPHTPGWRFEPRGIHSADGVCRPFDAAANGTVMGDGAGVVVLRRLEDALADGCHIHAVLRGSAVNNDGSRKIGYAAPSVAGQAEVVRAAMERAGLDPADIGYVETHGTGTPLGDRVEFQALREVYVARPTEGPRCVLASVKGAIGHLDVAAGVVGLVRAALALREKTLPGTANHRTPPADLGIESTTFAVPATAQPWPDGPGPRRAAVSSFGIGGTNAHVILEENHWAPRARTTASPTLADAGYQPQPHWPVPREPEPARSADPAAVSYHRATWHEWTPDNSPADRPEPARVVLLADADDTGDRLAAHLRAAHGEVVRINAEAVVPQAVPVDLGATVWRGEGRVLLVCAWGLADDEPARRGYDALTALAALWGADDRPASAVDAVVLTRGAHAVTDTGSGDLVVASITGLARVLAAEFPTLRARVLDLPSTAEPALATAAREASTWQAEPLLVLRGKRWWRRDFPPVPAPERTEGGGVSVVLGLGQVGSAAARVAARAGDRVVLAVRPGAVARAERFARDLPGPTALVESCD